MDFVAVDMGASNTRYLSMDGKINFISNNMCFIKDMDENLDNEWLTDKPEDNIDISIWKDCDSEFFPVRALVGEMAARFGSYEIRPTSDKKKVEQKVNYVSVILSTALSKLNNNTIGDELNLFVALPPAEVAYPESREKFISNLTGGFKVTFNRINAEGVTVQFKINAVKCVEESRLALLQFVSDENHPERAQKFSGSNLLSIDIGASTTDMVVFKKGKFQNKTGRTHGVGCNSALEKLVMLARQKYNRELTHEGAEQCLITGRIKSGTQFIEAKDIVEIAKREIANKVISKITGYFQSIDTPISSFDYIIVSGGGSMESSYIDETGKKQPMSEPMSKYITDALIDICPDVEVIQVEEEPRLANIYGLAKLAMRSNGEIKK